MKQRQVNGFGGNSSRHRCPRFDAEEAADVEHDDHCSDYKHPDVKTPRREISGL